MKSWSVPFPWGDLYKWPQTEGTLGGKRTPLTKGVRSVYVSYSVMMRLRSWGMEEWRNRRVGGGGSVWRSGGVITRRGAEGWEPRTGILFCQLECANGNVRAAGKLMNLIGEMPPLSPNAWSIAIVFPGRWCFSLLFFDCFLRLAWLFCG